MSIKGVDMCKLLRIHTQCEYKHLFHDSHNTFMRWVFFPLFRNEKTEAERSKMTYLG